MKGSNTNHPLSICNVPDALLGAWNTLFHLILPHTSWSTYECLHFADKKAEVD